LETIADLSGADDEQIDSLYEQVEKVAPEYADILWRNFHPEVKKVSEEHYKHGLYTDSLREAILAYVEAARIKMGLPIGTPENNIVDAIGSKLDFTLHYKKSGGAPFTNSTYRHLESVLASTGQNFWEVRDALSHDPQNEIIASGLITQRDCLDGLCYISKLFRRLDKAIVKKE